LLNHGNHTVNYIIKTVRWDLYWRT